MCAGALCVHVMCMRLIFTQCHWVTQYTNTDIKILCMHDCLQYAATEVVTVNSPFVGETETLHE